jgi:FKBP-type peptidyl-prolyl cis-trans isomerase
MWLLFAVLFFAACGKKSSHHKTPGGLTYQVWEGKGGDSIRKGDFVKMHVTQKVNDSVYFTSFDKFPVYFLVGESAPYDVSELWTRLRVGDSAVAVQMMDTFIKRNPQGLPPELKNGDRIYTHIKMLAVFPNDSLKLADKKKEEDAFQARESQQIEKYLADKNIKAEKTSSGVYVETLTPGTGELLKPGQYVSVKYTGTSFSGVTFDSNVDSTFGHTDPLSFTIAAGEMIRGFDDAMVLMRPGGKYRIYIPSLLAYADRPTSPKIKPYEILIFELEVIGVQEGAPQTPMMPPANK